MARYHVTLTDSPTRDPRSTCVVSTHRLYERAREAAAKVAKARGSWRGVCVTNAKGEPITLLSE